MAQEMTINRGDIKLMIDRLHSVDLLMDTCDNLTLDAAITMLGALSD